MGERLENMLLAVKDIVQSNEDVAVIYPMHPNPQVRKTAKDVLQGCNRVTLCEPLDVVDCHNIMRRSYLILTDSGGLQEEAAVLSVPVLVMRESTERPEGVRAGASRCVGTERERIAREVKRLLDNRCERDKMTLHKNPYGDGNASRHIADILQSV